MKKKTVRKPREEIRIKGEIDIGGYVINSTPIYGVPWLHGPDGDGMGMSPPTVEKLFKLIEKFFKENM